MPEYAKNYLKLERLSLIIKYYAYLDSEGYQADGLFDQASGSL
jgi:hypothetical protein